MIGPGELADPDEREPDLEPSSPGEPEEPARLPTYRDEPPVETEDAPTLPFRR